MSQDIKFETKDVVKGVELNLLRIQQLKILKRKKLAIED